MMIRATAALAFLACATLAAPTSEAPSEHCIFNLEANPELCAALQGDCPRDLEYYTSQLVGGDVNELFKDCAEALCCFCDGGDSDHPSCTNPADFGDELGRATLNEACEAVLEDTDMELGCEDHSGSDPAGDDAGTGKEAGDQCECENWGWHHWNWFGHDGNGHDAEEEEEEDRRRHNHHHHDRWHGHHGEGDQPLSGYVDVDGHCDCTYDKIVHMWALAGMVLTVVFTLLLTCCCCKRCCRKCKKRCEERCAHGRCGHQAGSPAMTSFTNNAYSMDDAKLSGSAKGASNLPPVYPVDRKLAEATLA